jgi:hypothetical protein
MAKPANDAALESARRLAAAAGILVPDDRLLVFAASVQRNLDLSRPVLERDYEETEPASRFRAPPLA